MDQTFRDQLKGRHDFESWKDKTTLDRDLHISKFAFTGREFPEWHMLRTDRSDTPAGPAFKAIWKRTEDELLSIDVLECPSRAAAHEELIGLLGEFQSPLIQRLEGVPYGDIVFAMPGETAVLFARGNLVVLLRNAGKKTMDFGAFAHRLDQALIERGNAEVPDRSE